MADCTFVLNGESLSELKCGTKAFPAFSGRGEHINRRQFACSYGTGPIPPGIYFIVDRESGGMLGGLRDYFTGRDTWFALYANDNRIDDKTFCNDIMRGHFRLHPKGMRGVSEGCVVIDDAAQFASLRAILKGSLLRPIPGSHLKAYGKLTVV